MSENTAVKMGTMPRAWSEGKAKTITFCVTEDCNLACKYCYMTGKNKKNKMTFEVAKKAVDFILTNKDFDEEAVIWEFIGGEPFLEIALIDRICEYIKQQMYAMDHPWFEAYRFSFSTNGVLYADPKVQEYIKKNRVHLSIGISVDGNKIKHDLQRVTTEGSGSYDDVMKVVPLWLEQFPSSPTKATFAHDDLIYLKYSVISLWDNGIDSVMANVVFEDVWHEGDDELFEKQLMELADYVIENKLWDKYSVRFFETSIGYPLQDDEINRNYCGSGKMLAVDCTGNLFPCVRFYDMSLNNRKFSAIGNINNGINKDRLRPFETLSLKAQSPEECVSCEVASGCAWCTGNNYDMADSDTIYQRMTFNCKMHKANVRANKYFWKRYKEATGLPSPRDIEEKKRYGNGNKKYMYFITSDKGIPYCNYKNWNNTDNVMSKDVFEKGLDFAVKEGYAPVILGEIPEGINMPENFYSILDSNKNTISGTTFKVYDNTVNSNEASGDGAILHVSIDSIKNLKSLVEKLFSNYIRVNVVLDDIEYWGQDQLEAYENQLDLMVDFIVKSKKEGKDYELNLLTDIFENRSMCNCDAGEESFALAPNGHFYYCPAFYFDNADYHTGSLDTGINVKNKNLFKVSNSPVCSMCDSYQCKRCKFLNKKLTFEINTPSRIQCIISHTERNKSKKLQEILKSENMGIGLM